jgi:hypothetical protein
MWKAGTFKVVAPRLCRLRTDGLTPASKYWMYRSHACVMGPVSLVAGCQPKLVFSRLPHWLLWERSWVRTYRLDDHRAVDCVRSPSSRGQWICTNLLMAPWKVAMHWPREIRMVKDHTWTERERRVVCWSGFPLQGVHRFELLWISDMSTACLWQSACR